MKINNKQTNMSKREAVKEYIRKHGNFYPAKMANRAYRGVFLGSEIGRVCRKMRAEHILSSQRDKQYVFFVEGRKFKK